MIKYRFAQIFIKVSRFVGILFFAFGIIYSVWYLVGVFRQVDLASYSSGEKLISRISRLENEKARALRVLRSKGFSTSNMNLTGELPDAPPSSEDDFVVLVDALNGFRDETLSIKSDIVDEFERSIDIIRQKLLDHAKSVGSSGPDQAAKHVPAQREESVRIPKDEHLFDSSRALSFPILLDETDQVRNFLSEILQESSQEDSKKTLSDAIADLNKLTSLIPIAITPKSEIESDSSRSTVLDDSPVNQSVRAELVANLLEQSKATVRESILADWLLDREFEEVYQLALSEKSLFTSASQEKRIVLAAGIRVTFLNLLVAICIPFLTLVFGDFLQTQLDIARHGARIADAVDSRVEAGE
jgi:hypothetical protein